MMTTPVRPIEPSLRAVLQDAAAWRLLGRLFECPAASWRVDVAALAREVTDPDLAAAANAALEEANEGSYHSVFGPGGPAPPREVSYLDTLELGSVMSSLTGYYAAFGYRPETVEAPDHVSVEVGFLAYLGIKQAYAMMEGDTAHAAAAREAADTFRVAHLAMSAERLAELLTDGPIGYLASAATMLAARVGPRPGPKMLPVIQPPVDDDSEFLCEGL